MPQPNAAAAVSRIWRVAVAAAVLLLLLLSAAALAQNHQQNIITSKAIDTTVYTYVEQMPQPPGGGGNRAIVALIQKGIRLPLFCGQYPERSRVIVEFTVMQTGLVEHIRIRQSVCSRVDTAVVQAVRGLPRFTPARQHGQPVRVRYAMPIIFHWQ